MKKTLINNIINATNLTNLCDALNAYSDFHNDSDFHDDVLSLDDAVDMCNLPIFGGDPITTGEVWSWDEDSFIDYNGGRFVLESREEFGI